ncbi:MAG: HAD family hydrolase [Promethearchaeota archaeon]
MSQQISAKNISLKNIKLIIFDMDGVILDIVGSVKKATRDAVNKFSEIKVKDPDEILEELAILIEKIQTIPIPRIILRAKELINVSFVEDITVLKYLEIGAHIYTKFKKYKQTEANIYDGIEKLIKFLSKKRKKLAILTNNKKSYAIETLEKHGLEENFNEILGYNEVKNVKPDPEGLLKILEIEGIDPNNALFVGDMISDAQAGKRAGVKTICVVSGLSKKEDLENENPFMIVNNTTELARVFGLEI